MIEGVGRPKNDEVPLTKICFDCKVRKNLDRFPNFKRGKYGKFSYCFACQTKRTGHWRKSNPTKALLQEKRRSFRSGRRFAGFLNSNRRRGVEVRITQDQWLDIIENKACTYCGGGLPQKGLGLDRKDSSKPYTIDNVVPCCTLCNRIKNAYFSYEEFMRIGPVIREIIQERNKL